MNHTIALLLSIISSPDVTDVDTQYIGRCSWFNADLSSALAFSQVVSPYCACRWNYDRLARRFQIPRREIKRFLHERCIVRVLNPENGKTIECTPIDWGPARKTGRAIDLDKHSMEFIEAKTDDKLVFELRRVR